MALRASRAAVAALALAAGFSPAADAGDLSDPALEKLAQDWHKKWVSCAQSAAGPGCSDLPPGLSREQEALLRPRLTELWHQHLERGQSGERAPAARTDAPSAPAPAPVPGPGAPSAQAPGSNRAPESVPGAPALPGGPAASPGEEAQERTMRRAETGTGKAAGLARRLAESMKSREPAPEGGAPGKSAAADASGRAPGTGPAASRGLDLVSAASSGLGAELKAAGYSIGRGADGRPVVLDPGGRPADEKSLAALQKRLDAAPGVLLKRPDLYKHVSPERYEALKRYHGVPGAEHTPQFRDIGRDARDFVWTRSCDKVSGDCNRFAVEPSYRRAAHVSPETLRSVHQGAAEASNEDDQAWAQYVREQKGLFERERPGHGESLAEYSRRSLSRLSSRGLSRMLDRLLRRPSSPEPEDAPEREAEARARGGAAGREPPPRGRAASGEDRRPEDSSGELAPPPDDALLPWWRWAAAAAGALLLAAGLWLRRRAGPR